MEDKIERQANEIIAMSILTVKLEEIMPIKIKKIDLDNHKIVIEFDDVTYSINAPQSFEYFSRYNKGYLNAVIITGAPGPNHYRVNRYDRCGKKVGSVDLPVANIISEPADPTRPSPVFEKVVEEYGKPVIGPNGDVYAWKRTPDTYSILKWTWLDDPSDPKAGDCNKKKR